MTKPGSKAAEVLSKSPLLNIALRCAWGLCDVVCLKNEAAHDWLWFDG